jgi:hypothetical protein
MTKRPKPADLLVAIAPAPIVGAGACFGMSEHSIKGIATAYAAHPDVVAVLHTPYPYAVIGTAALALGQLQVALHRHRIATVVSVLTVIAKTELVVVGSPAFRPRLQPGEAR